MHLFYFVPEFPSQTHAFFWREIQALRGLGVRVSIVSTRRPPDEACRHNFANSATAETLYLFPPSSLLDALFALRRPQRLIKAIKYIRHLEVGSLRERLLHFGLLISAFRLFRLTSKLRADHLHVHSFANSAHIAALSRVLGGCTYSLTLHGDLSVYGKDHSSKVSGASFVTSVTKHLQKQISQATELSAEKNHLLWMGVDTRRFKPRPSHIPRKNQLRILTVARLHPNKGHIYALKAIAQARQAGLQLDYVIVGEGPARSDIEANVRKLGVDDIVTLAGTCSEDEILEMLQGADALILPSIGLGEAAPVSVMEAMACGLPVVCSIIGGTTEMITDGVNGFLVEQAAIQDIELRLTQLACDVSLRQRIGRAAREHAEHAFDSSVLATRLLELVRRCAEQDILPPSP